ncbi:MAG: hypothetical protein JAZ19_12030, partial [Candidatus Thiodiazotropha taylori]|nr:hypothetical protein [Candidatus Thiodiazotropha taylori]
MAHRLMVIMPGVVGIRLSDQVHPTDAAATGFVAGLVGMHGAGIDCLMIFMLMVSVVHRLMVIMFRMVHVAHRLMIMPGVIGIGLSYQVHPADAAATGLVAGFVGMHGAGVGRLVIFMLMVRVIHWLMIMSRMVHVAHRLMIMPGVVGIGLSHQVHPTDAATTGLVAGLVGMHGAGVGRLVTFMLMVSVIHWLMIMSRMVHVAHRLMIMPGMVGIGLS